MSITDVTRHISDEVDDVLTTLPLAHGQKHLEDELFSRLVDLSLEWILVDLVGELEGGAISPDRYGHELGRIAEQCRRVGLVPPS